MRKEDRRQNIVVVASEPLTFEKADWMEVPTNTMIIVTPQMNVLQIPILDEYSPLDRPHPSRVPVVKRGRTQSTTQAANDSLGALQLNGGGGGEGKGLLATQHRSPAFALHAGFPPNSHIGSGVGPAGNSTGPTNSSASNSSPTRAAAVR